MISTPKEKPIIFGSFKMKFLLEQGVGAEIQTRRPIKPKQFEGNPIIEVNETGSLSDQNPLFWQIAHQDGGSKNISMEYLRCPYGAPGDGLWVREALVAYSPNIMNVFAAYGADKRIVPSVGIGSHPDVPMSWRWKNKRLPARYMPKAACRVRLQLTEVRGERLKDITIHDVVQEGAYPLEKVRGTAWMPAQEARGTTPGVAFFDLWRSIYGDDSVRANPWVWALTARIVEVRGAA